jgi:hypothetical protein
MLEILLKARCLVGDVEVEEADRFPVAGILLQKGQ